MTTKNNSLFGGAAEQPATSNEPPQQSANQSTATQAPEEKKQEQPANTQVTTIEKSPADRFMMAVERQFSSDNGAVVLTNFQKALIRSYFIKIDMVLKAAEAKRVKAFGKKEDLPFNWGNVNMPQLSIDVVNWSSIGLDPMQPNHLNPVPYKNDAINKYNFTFIIGYKGTEIKARKYGLLSSVPDEVIVELVYSNDKFKAIKKDRDNKIETYTLLVDDAFNRGTVVGGFYYYKFNATPEKNYIKPFSKAEIDKRKPTYASPEFWGGERDKWEYDQEQGKRVKNGKEVVEGWYDEMAYKTIYKAAYNAITIDAERIDEHYQATLEKENEWRENKALININEDIETNGNKKPLEITDSVITNTQINAPVAEVKQTITPAVEQQMEHPDF